jgi:ubiquinone/menaquinone biosynthesis C-methylase UbiE
MTETQNEAAQATPRHEGYVMDAENAAEMARLMVQDRLLNQAMGGLLSEQSDLTSISQVLDIACGPGGWLLDLMIQYPHMQGVGIDISQLMIAYANSQAEAQQLPKLQFHVMDATKPLDFPDQQFDLVNGRIFTGFLSTQQWAVLLSECARITSPGGILRLTEAEWAFTNSTALDKLAGLCTLGLARAGHSFSPHGRTFGTTAVLGSLMKQAGYEVLGCKAHAVDYSAGAPYHESNAQNMLVGHKQLQPFYVQMQLATMEEVDLLLAQMEEDLSKPDFCGVDFYLTVWGWKKMPD